MRNITDELAFGFVQFYLAGNVLYSHGNTLNTFPVLIENRGEKNANGAVRWLGKGDAKLCTVAIACDNLVQGAS